MPRADREQFNLGVSEQVAHRRVDELDRFRTVGMVEVIDLVDHQQNARDAIGGLTQQLPLGLGQRLSGVQHVQCRIDLREKTAGDLRVVTVNRADPRRVDQLESGAKQLVVELDSRQLHTAPVPWISCLGDVVGELGERPLLFVAVRETDEELIVAARGNSGHDRGQWDHTGRQHRPLQQRVDQRALPTFELAEHHQVEPILGNSGARRGQMPARCD